MAAYSDSSNAKLDTCHPNLGLVFREVVKWFDNTIVFGWRSREEQQRLYAQGRTMPGKIVTYKDGINKLSNHQGLDGEQPSLAVDATPYPIDWQDEERMVYFAGHVMGIAYKMGVAMRWGGDWNRNGVTEEERFRDLPHFELILR